MAQLKALAGALNRQDVVWHCARSAPFEIFGLYRSGAPGPFRRLPQDVAAATSREVEKLARNTSGGRVRFVTDSPFIAIHAEMPTPEHMDHMTDCGTFGFDLYLRQSGEPIYRGTYRPPVGMTEGYEAECALPGGCWEATLNFPLYADVDELWIGLQNGCRLEAAKAYPRAQPVVFYGSSITQGGCASRPGNSYVNMISRMLDVDVLNLGFSGSGKAEMPICEYMAGLDAAAFVCDYDHNAPNADYLRGTHERLYRTLRAAHPKLPILFLSRPDVLWNEAECDARRAVIRHTYETAVAEGDEFVAFIDGKTLLEGPMRDACTVDGCHPNDLGMMRMAQTIGEALRHWITPR